MSPKVTQSGQSVGHINKQTISWNEGRSGAAVRATYSPLIDEVSTQANGDGGWTEHAPGSIATEAIEFVDESLSKTQQIAKSLKLEGRMIDYPKTYIHKAHRSKQFCLRSHFPKR